MTVERGGEREGASAELRAVSGVRRSAEGMAHIGM